MSAAAWYAARSAGIVAYLLLSGSVVVGLLLSGRRRLSWPRFTVEEVHRFLGILAGVFIAVHGGALLLDRVVPFSVGQELVPFTSSYRPFAVGLGVASAELLAAIGITNLLRKRLPYRLWRRVHYLTFVVWLGGGVHVLLTGTDRRDVWLLALVAVSVAAVALCALTRFAGEVTPVATATAVGATLVAVFALAYTPQPPASAATATGGVPRTFEGDVSAQVEQQERGGLVSVVGNAGSASMRVDLVVAGDQIEQTSLRLGFDSGATCTGTVSSLDGSGLVGTCRAAGASRTVRVSWTVAGSSVTGRLALSPTSAGA
jgi:methionine sulfoxide reductase heme-binding subunit